MKLSSTKHSLVLALVATAMLLFHSAAFAIGPTYSGSWYNPEQSGHGFSIEYSELSDGTPLFVAYWYVYDTEGNPIFLIGTGEPEGNSVVLEFTAPYGMKYGEFDPDTTQRPDAGVGMFTFDDPKTGTFDYEPSEWIASAYGLSAITTPVKMLLGVAHPNDEPPTGEPVPLPGLWSGRMVYDRDYAGSNTCYNADVLINVGYYNNLLAVRDVTVDRDGGSTSSSDARGFIQNNYVTGSIYPFSIKTEYSLRFNDYGQAEGSWREDDYDSNCYGTWSFSKEQVKTPVPALLKKLWQYNPMIVAGTSPLIWIDLGSDEPGMTLQRLEGRVWVDYVVDGEVVISPVKIEKLPSGKYRLVM